MYKTPIIRIQNATIKNFRNVISGSIRFPCNLNADIFSPQADVLGIYGQNGSGKTSFIDCLEILKALMTGNPISPDLTDCIAYGAEAAELYFEFSVLDPCGAELGSEQNKKAKVSYSVILRKDSIDESLKFSTWNGEKWSWPKTAFACSYDNQSNVFTPDSNRKVLFGNNQQKMDELRVAKILCTKERRSFLFSPEFLSAVEAAGKDSLEGNKFLFALRYFALTSFFVILNQRNGLIALNTFIPFEFRTEHAGGSFALPVDSPVVIPAKLENTMQQVISTVSLVLRKIVPGTELALVKLGEELMENGEVGHKVQLVRNLHAEDGQVYSLPLKYESEGIKKIVSILHLFVATYNNPSITLAIDEFDSGIYEHLLGELLQIMQDSGKGQLIFTSHNLHPLEVLDTASIVFTSTDAANCYTKIKNVRKTNNLRSMYLREIGLGCNNKCALCEETNSADIAYAMRSIGYGKGTDE